MKYLLWGFAAYVLLSLSHASHYNDAFHESLTWALDSDETKENG